MPKNTDNAQYRKQLARNRFMELLNNRGQVSDDDLMRSAYMLGGEYAGLNFDTAEYHLPKGSFREDALPGGGTRGRRLPGGYDQTVSSLMDLDQSVSSVARPLRGHEKHVLSDSGPRQLQTPYLDPHRSPQYEGQDPVYRGKTPQFSLGTIDQLKMDKPSPFDPTGRGPVGQRTYEQREGMAKEKIAGLNLSDVGRFTKQGLEAFGEVAPLMQARGKTQLQRAVMDKITGKMQIEASRKMVELGFKQFNKAAEAAKTAAFGVKMASQNPMLLADRIPTASTTILDALNQVQDMDTNTAETFLGWMSDQGGAEGRSALENAATELSAAQESLAADVAGIGVSMGREAGRGQGDIGGAAARTGAAFAGAKGGAAIGGALGAMTGPAAPVMAPVLSFFGGALGGMGGAAAGKKLAPVAGQKGGQEIARPESGLGKKPTMDELMEGGQ